MTKKWSLESKNIWFFYLVKNINSSCFHFILRNIVWTIFQAKYIAILTKNIRVKSKISNFLVDTSINKTVHFFRMPMKIHTKLYIFKTGDKSAQKKNLWMQPTIWLLPLPIQIKTCQVCSKIPINNTIGIHHRNNNKFKHLYKFFVKKNIIYKGL
jgi:hypothetical protein